jgi:hypothetical protein
MLERVACEQAALGCRGCSSGKPAMRPGSRPCPSWPKNVSKSAIADFEAPVVGEARTFVPAVERAGSNRSQGHQQLGFGFTASPQGRRTHPAGAPSCCNQQSPSARHRPCVADARRLRLIADATIAAEIRPGPARRERARQNCAIIHHLLQPIPICVVFQVHTGDHPRRFRC